MESIEHIFSDGEGNHLLVALCFCDDDYKRHSLHIPEEYLDTRIIDIDITKAYVDRPINPVVFFKMSAWLFSQFEELNDSLFTYICSFDDLTTRHDCISPQEYRWNLFNKLYERQLGTIDSTVHIQDVIVGPDGFQSFARAFYRDCHAPVIHLIASYLREKQHPYM